METIKRMLKWVGIDGLLHFLVCYAMMLTFTPIVGMTWTIIFTTSLAVTKEVIDFCIQKDNDEKAVLHDLSFDVAGVMGAIVVIAAL